MERRVEPALLVGLLHLHLDTMQSLDEVPSLSSIQLPRLKGKRRHQGAMMISGAWRLVFEFKKGHAYNVESVDYH